VPHVKQSGGFSSKACMHVGAANEDFDDRCIERPPSLPDKELRPDMVRTADSIALWRGSHCENGFDVVQAVSDLLRRSPAARVFILYIYRDGVAFPLQ
jgi:hypothetical protein